PVLVNEVIAADISVLNNSWASNYEISDLSKSVIAGALGAELPAWQKAVADGMVMVWAAGNDGDDDVSVRAGLPYHYPELRDGWLAVTSLDDDDTEPRYSNRCGLARDWCVAAPGGGDIASFEGLYGARSSGGFERRSGTSMAAPQVTGALALVLDAFPQLSPQQAAVRLLETASYDGLTTADDCTIDSCSEAEMADVFGRGKISVTKALAPIGPLSLRANGAAISLQDTRLSTGLVIDEALFSAMTGVRFQVTDQFDEAVFSVSGQSLMNAPSEAFDNQHDEAQIIMVPLQQNASDGQMIPQADPSKEVSFYMSNEGRFPAPLFGKARLYDLSAQPVQRWTGLQSQNWQAHIGYDDDRQLLLMSHQPDTALDDVSHWVTFGTERTKGRWLDSKGAGALRWGAAQSQWVVIGGYHPVYSGGITAEYLSGISVVEGTSHCLICAASADLESWRLSYERSVLPAYEATYEISLRQPLYASHLSLRLSGATQTTVRLSPKRALRVLEQRLSYAMSGGDLAIVHSMKPSQGANRAFYHGGHHLRLNWSVAF
ncbi:MAG: S8 family peptidase, partial [Candidatus Puniceispirillaceae bacterium]